MEKDTGFAGRLRELREAAGLSRKGLAAASGVAAGAIRDLEQGVRSPRWSTVLLLAEALKVPTDAFKVKPGELPPDDEPTPKRGRPKKKPPPD